MDWCVINWCQAEGSCVLWMMDWMGLWMKYRVGFWVEFRMVFMMMRGAGRGKLVVGYGVVVHLVVRSLWKWSRKDWKECRLVGHRVYCLRT